MLKKKRSNDCMLQVRKVSQDIQLGLYTSDYSRFKVKIKVIKEKKIKWLYAAGSESIAGHTFKIHSSDYFKIKVHKKIIKEK